MDSTTINEEYDRAAAEKDQQDANLSDSSKVRREYNLSLRKAKMTQFFFKNRGLYKVNPNYNKYQITKDTLNLDQKILEAQYEDNVIFEQSMMKYLTSSNKEEIKYAILNIRSQTVGSNRLQLCKEFFDIGLIDKLYDILNSILTNKHLEEKQIIFEILWILINSSYALESEDLNCLISDRWVQIYMSVMELKEVPYSESVIWILSNLVCTKNNEKILLKIYLSPLIRKYLLPFVHETQNMSLSTAIHIIRIFSIITLVMERCYTDLAVNNISYFKNKNIDCTYENLKENNDFLLKEFFVIFINKVLNPDLSFNCLYGLGNLSNFVDRFPDIITLFFSSGIVRKIVRNEIKTNESRSSAIKIVGNFLTYTDESSLDAIVLNEICLYLKDCILTSPEKMVRRDALWAISNITCGNSLYIKNFVDTGLLSEVLNLSQSEDGDVVLEALFCLGGFFDFKNAETVTKNYTKDYIDGIYFILNTFRDKGKTVANFKVIQEALFCLFELFVMGESVTLLTGGNVFKNDFTNKGGQELLSTFYTDFGDNVYVKEYLENISQFYNSN